MKILLRHRPDPNPSRPAVALAFLFLALSLLSACAGFQSFKVESQALPNPITIDGKDDDWKGHLYYNVQGQYSLGFTNDDRNLYVCLVVTDPYKRSEIIRGGLVLWIDPKGGDARTFGVRFPLPWRAGAAANRGEGQSQLPPENDLGQPIGPEVWSEFTIITPKNELPILMKTEEGKGLEMKAAAPAGMFVYELRIPLHKSVENPWAVGTDPGHTVSLGFEAGRTTANEFGRGGRSGYGGMGGRGGYPGGGYGRGDYGPADTSNYGRGIQIPEELRVWAVVKLR